jgi:hypothetical protein
MVWVACKVSAKVVSTKKVGLKTWVQLEATEMASIGRKVMLASLLMVGGRQRRCRCPGSWCGGGRR